MKLIPSIPLTILVVVGGALTAGLAAEASSLDQRIEGFVPVDDTTLPEATQATGQAANGTIETVHLAIEPAGPGTVDVAQLSIAGDAHAETLEPLRDEDGSLAEDRLTESDLARLTVHLGSPMPGGEERTIVLDLGSSTAEITVRSPRAIEDGYTRMSIE
jgi:hypothetical protein